MSNEIQEYASHNAMARVSLIFGVPIMTLLAFLILMLVTGGVGFFFFGVMGLITPLMLLFVLFGIRILCLENPNAMTELKWKAKAYIYRLQCRSMVTSFTSTDTPQKRRMHHVREWIKNPSNHQ